MKNEPLIQALELQRNVAQNQNAELMAENAVLRRRIEELETELKEVKE